MRLAYALFFALAFTNYSSANSSIEDLETGCYFSRIEYEKQLGRQTVQLVDLIYLNVYGSGKWKTASCDEFVPYPNYCWRQSLTKAFELLRVASVTSKNSFSMFVPGIGTVTYRKIRSGNCSR